MAQSNTTIIDPRVRVEQVKAKYLSLAEPDFLERHRAFCAGEIDDDRIRCLDCEKWQFKSYYKKWGCDESIGCVPEILRRCTRSIKKQDAN